MKINRTPYLYDNNGFIFREPEESRPRDVKKLRPNYALRTFTCPHCNATVTKVVPPTTVYCSQTCGRNAQKKRGLFELKSRGPFLRKPL